MRWFSALLLSVSLASPAAIAEPSPPTEAAAQEVLSQILGELKVAYASIDAIQADFVQVVRSPTFGDNPPQAGTLTVAKPNRMRVEFTGPQAAQFITDGQTLWVYSPENQQVFITPDLSDQRDGLQDLLSSLGALEQRFEVALVEHDAGRALISLRPREGEASQFQQLRIELDRENAALKRLEMVDAFGSVTEMTMNTMNMSPTLPEGLFHFIPPEGAEVIRTDQF
ncbi:MAG: outer membrane lipoprotein chaperone LolA [Myxococcota bacterium]